MFVGVGTCRGELNPQPSCCGQGAEPLRVYSATSPLHVSQSALYNQLRSGDPSAPYHQAGELRASASAFSQPVLACCSAQETPHKHTRNVVEQQSIG